MRYKDDDSYQDYLVGRTGVFNIFNDYNILDIKFRGRRMVQVDPEKYPYLDE